MLIEGPARWGEFRPFADYDDTASATWLTTTIEQCTLGRPEPGARSHPDQLRRSGGRPRALAQHLVAEGQLVTMGRHPGDLPRGEGI
jgi:hypothetical protein